MRRLAALLLVLMLPCGVLAETVKLTVKTEMSAALAEEFIQLLLPEVADDASINKVKIIAQIAQRVFDGFSLEFTMQEDASSGRVSIGGNELLDMDIYQQQGMSYMTSSLLPGYALVEEATYSVAEAADTNWVEIAGSVGEVIRSWFVGFTPVTDVGAFSGNAYDGGTHCTTWQFTGQDISNLLSDIMGDDLQAALTPWLAAGGYDAVALFADVNEMLSDMNNASCCFILRVVEDDNAELIGVSLTIFREDAQIATVSIGAGEVVRIVVGLGLPAENYWWELTLRRSALGNMTQYSGTSREWSAAKEQSFTYVLANSKPKAQHGWNFTARQNGEVRKWSVALFPFEGEDSGEPQLSVDVALEPAEALGPMPDGLTICDSADPEAYESFLNRFSAVLAARMIKCLPMDLILQLNMLP